MEDEGRQGSALGLVIEALRRRKWLAVVAFAVPFSAVASVAMFVPSIYRSTARVLVEGQQVPEAFVKPTVTNELGTRLDTISEEILSRSRLLGVIERFGLYPTLRGRVSSEAIVGRMRKDIHVEFTEVDPRGQRGGTVAFAISYRGRDPQAAAQVANLLAASYVEENLKVRGRQAAGTAEFLKAQLADTKKRLDEQERRVSEFKKRYVGGLPQQIEANLATLERLNAQLRLNSDNQTRAMERRQALARQMNEGGIVGPSGEPDSLAGRISLLKQQLAELRTQFSERYPDVIRVKTEIAALERLLGDGGPDKSPPRESSPTDPYLLRVRQTLSEVDADVRVLKSEEQRLRGAIATYQTRVESTPVREQEFQELSRDYETTKELYRSLLTKYGEAQIAESMEQRQKGEQFRILDPAIPLGEPATPKRSRLIIVGVVLSLALAVGVVLVAEKIDTSFHTVDDLRAFSTVPVLASIPLIWTETDRVRRRRRIGLAAVSGAVGLALIISAAYLVAHGNEELTSMLSRGLLS